ncbi:MAG: polysaccharide biosynthesis protein [Ketobacter sp.]|nr:polysaccharide biosynthesis protein [Ketobacter sp.]
MLSKLINLPRSRKYAVFAIVDFLTIPLVVWLSFNLRLDFQYGFPDVVGVLTVVSTLLVTVLVYARLGMYRAMLRHVGLELAWALARGAAASAVFLAVFSYLFDNFLPRSVPIIYFFMLLVVSGGLRFSVRHIVFRLISRRCENVAIYGAGDAGAQVYSALAGSKDYRPVVFVDDDPRKIGRTLRGVRVVGRNSLPRLIRQQKITELLLAMPSATHAQRKEVLDVVSPMPVHVRTIPGIDDLVSGKAQIGEFQEVDVEDLLGRDPVPPDHSLLYANIADKVVMVTGAGGSIGSELCRQIAVMRPKALVLFERSEFALYSIEQELAQALKSGSQDGVSTELYPVLGSVLNDHKLEMIIQSLGVQTIYHAAAYKHVPLVEYNVAEGIRNNVFGTLNLALAAERFGVETCVLVSTDKAVRPTSIMGASKRLAEMVFQAMHAKGGKTCYCMVRFGNVLGSSGSVIPLFREQIANGGPVTVTHPDIIRYFMTIPEAAQLVIQAGAMARGGDVFVLDMGEPVKIADLACKMIALMGLSVREEGQEGGVGVVYTGLRPGEKLFEELLIGENVTATDHPRVMRAQEFLLPWVELQALLVELQALCDGDVCADVRQFLMHAPIGYSPQSPVEDILWKNRPVESAECREPVGLENLGGKVVSIDARKEFVS